MSLISSMPSQTLFLLNIAKVPSKDPNLKGMQFTSPPSSETQGRSVGPVEKALQKFCKCKRKSPWVPTLTGPFPNGQANAGSWLGTKNALYYCAQSANSISWVLFVSSYTTAIDSITACLAHAPKKCTQSGIFQFDINGTFQNTASLNTRG